MNLIWILAAAAAISAPPDALAPAREGQVQCYKPDTVNRTCGQLASYSFEAKDGVVETQDIVIVSSPLVVLHAVSTVTLAGDTVCGTLAKSDIDNATITVEGKPAPDDLAVKVRAQLLEIDGPDIGKSACTTFQVDGDHFAARQSIGGNVRPELTVPVIWIKPGDGYKLGGSP